MDRDLTNLIKTAQLGDVKAFASAYGVYAADMYRFALSYTGNSFDAQDCVQDAALTSFEKLSSLKKPSAFKSWMFKILANVCVSHLRSDSRSKENVPIDEAWSLNDERASDAQMSAEVKEALDSLSEQERQIVLLSVIGRCKSGEIAEITGLTAGSVRSKLSRSLGKLKTALE